MINKVTQSTLSLAILLPITIFIASKFSKISLNNAGTALNGVENFMSVPAVFGTVVLIQGLFGSSGFDTPDRLQKILDKPGVSIAALFLVTYSGTNDVELSFFVVLSFLLLMQLLRTKAEREEHPYLV